MRRLLYLVPLFLLLMLVPAAAQDIQPCLPPPTCLPERPCPPVVPCRPPTVGGVFTNPEWLKINYHRVNVTIENQIATTDVDMEFVNEGNGLAEGTFMFPLPQSASVDKLVMYVNGVAIEAKILPADEARNIYNEIVRQYRDPALLEYIGSSAIQANVFPIPPGETRRIQISYSTILEVDNALVHYIYPMKVTNLLTYRESANEAGFFMLLVQPPVSLPENQIIAKDVIVVLDQSGSMQG
ncbi:MAG: VIT domain-containing protein, partial [Candidatus Methanoperedens sp.]|nr:VIT domain-containing protein [Candidatus Methanoperedens sp.]